MSFGDHGGGEQNGSETCVLYFMTHNHLCTCITLTKWDGPVVCVYVTENVENFQSKFYHFTTTQTSLTVSVKQHEHDRVTRCTFSVDFKEIKTISQSLPSLCTICLQPRQSGFHRGEIETPRLPWIFECELIDIYSQDVCHTRQALTKWRIKCPKLTQDGMLNMSSCY